MRVCLDVQTPQLEKQSFGILVIQAEGSTDMKLQQLAAYNRIRGWDRR
jgi:hypothetical protein